MDLETSARGYTDPQVETALQLSVYSYAVGLSPFVNGDDMRRRFDVLTKTKQPELCRYARSGRERAALPAGVGGAGAVKAGAFHPIVGWQCKDCVLRSKCWAWK